MPPCHFAAPRLRHSLLFTSLLLAGSFSAHAMDEMLHKAVGKGVYEMAYSQQESALWVITSQSRSLNKDGVIYRLDPTTLDVTQITYNDLKPFGAAINHATGTLWFGNAVSSTVTVIDAKTDAVKGHPVLDERQRSETARPLRPRELAVNERTNTVYITGLGREGTIWVVDGVTLKLKTTTTGAEVIATDSATDLQAERLYTTNTDGELLAIDSESNTTVLRKKLQNDGKTHFYLSLSLDIADHRASTIDSKQSEVLVVSTRNGRVLEKIAASESLAILSSPTRNETYVTCRKAGEVSAIDGRYYKIVKTFKMPTHPNGLALSDDSKTLYVSIKRASSREKEATAPDDVIRIAL